MVRFLGDRLIEPIDEFLHPTWRFEWRGGIKYNAQTFAIGTKSLDMVRHFLVVPAMLLILAAVFEKNSMQLLDVVFCDRYGLETLENHIHCIGIAGHFLLVAACERLRLHAGEQLFHFPIAESCAFNSGGGANALDRCDAPQAGEFFRRECLHHLPSPLELIDLGDELQNFGRDRDVADLASVNIHLYPFLPDCYPKASNIHLYPFAPISTLTRPC